ncbi:MAG: hypothetical protein JWP89_1576 [Schlesneria sp.]|nr:hypothetical protein [Schlesneria sp.]
MIRGFDEAQLMTYMKLADIQIEIFINFNTRRLKDGVSRTLPLRALRVLRGEEMLNQPVNLTHRRWRFKVLAGCPSMIAGKLPCMLGRVNL